MLYPTVSSCTQRISGGLQTKGDTTHTSSHMSERSFSENTCASLSYLDVPTDQISWYGEAITSGIERGVAPISELTMRDLTLPRRNATQSQVQAIQNLPRSQAIQQPLGCDGYECNNPTRQIRENKDFEFAGSFTHNTKSRDAMNEGLWELSLQPQYHTVRSRADVAHLLQSQVEGNNQCAADPASYLGQSIPLFADAKDDSLRLGGEEAERNFQYRMGTGKEWQGQYIQNFGRGASSQGNPTTPGFGQFSRVSDPTNRYCRSDFAPNLGAL